MSDDINKNLIDKEENTQTVELKDSVALDVKNEENNDEAMDDKAVLESMGFPKELINRIYSVMHPANLEEALDYLNKNDRDKFTHSYIANNLNVCSICGYKRSDHALDDILQNMDNIEEEKEEEKKEEEKKEEEKKEEEVKDESKKGFDEKKSNLPKEIYPKDEWDDEEFTWEEEEVKPGFKRPCIVHRAILGSVERCTAILIEHYAGKWPFWLSPRQVAICTINDKVNDFADKVYLELKLKGFQVEFDKSPGTINKKVRNAQLALFNFILVIGQEEVNGNCVDVRNREGERIGKYTLEKLIEYFKTFEPELSNKEIEMWNKVNEGVKFEEFDECEKKLKFNLFLNGDDVGDDDKKLFEKVEKVDIDKEKYPNLFKWKKLMNMKKA